MANSAELSAELERKSKAPSPVATIKDYFEKVAGPAMADVLPRHLSPERLTRLAIGCVRDSPMLQRADPVTLAGALMTAAQLGLEPGATFGHCYLIPRKNNRQGGRIDVQLQIGYKGWIELANRSAQITNVDAGIVREGDHFEWSKGLNPVLDHKPADSDRGEMTHVWALFLMKNGGHHFEVMSRQEIETHRDRYAGNTKPGSAWHSNFEEMGRKTVLLQCVKYVPMSSDFRDALAADDTVRTNFTGAIETDVVPVAFSAEDPSAGELQPADEAPATPEPSSQQPATDPEPHPAEDSASEGDEAPPQPLPERLQCPFCEASYSAGRKGNLANHMLNKHRKEQGIELLIEAVKAGELPNLEDVANYVEPTPPPVPPQEPTTHPDIIDVEIVDDDGIIDVEIVDDDEDPPPLGDEPEPVADAGEVPEEETAVGDPSTSTAEPDPSEDLVALRFMKATRKRDLNKMETPQLVGLSRRTGLDADAETSREAMVQLLVNAEFPELVDATE